MMTKIMKNLMNKIIEFFKVNNIKIFNRSISIKNPN